MTVPLPASGSTSWYSHYQQLDTQGRSARPTFNAVASYGADNTGASNASTAIQNALNAASAAGGGVVYLAAGTYLLNAGLSVPAHVTLLGDGANATVLSWSPTTGDAVSLGGDRAAVVNLTAQKTGSAATAGAMVVLSSGSFPTVQGVGIVGGYDNTRCDNAYGFLIDNCYITDPARYGCLFQSVTEPDRGDSVLRSCTFDTANPTVGTAIRYESGGGLKISTTKILHHDYGIVLAPSDGTTTSILTVTGCSIENQNTTCIRLNRAGSTGVFTEVLITGCQINGATNADGLYAGLGIEDVSITGNTFKGPVSKTGINLDGIQRVIVTGNSFRGWGNGVVKSNSTPRVVVGDNNYGDVSIPLTDDVAQNLTGPGRSTRVHRSIVSTTSTTTYTNLYRVEWNVYRGSKLSITIEGLLGNVGNVTRHIELLAKRDAGNVAVSTISDTTAGAACDVQLDVTTTAGSLLIGVRRNSAAGGTQLDATVTLAAEGGTRLVQVL